MSKLKYIIITANLVLLAVLFLFSVNKTEGIINKGESVYLRLAPVDPRSMMQGDYMRLRLDINDRIRRIVVDSTINISNYAIIDKDNSNLLRVQNDSKTENDKEIALKLGHSYYSREVAIKNLFFEEGTAKKYDDAKYAHIKVDEQGNCILISLCDEDKKDIK